MSERPIITCACCNRTGRHHGRRLIASCYTRRQRNGSMQLFPKVTPNNPWQPTSRHGRRMPARYQALAAVRPPLSKRTIALELGVSVRSVERYAAASRAQQATNQPPQPRTEAA
ncbi:hypothetical protein MF672_039010 [Actinomadura sp. ATCC 31491]|uniref:Uncharacterized protein n=1 Tax=Actinomadura luzonensis TaxID=2805427 RepID=A0ABT0G595_9ACTN|nr:hypothetical protein [Actinomadura luzonensis]MCK2219745.1 hypothetical protein [Actinomadura luzonensis]